MLIIQQIFLNTRLIKTCPGGRRNPQIIRKLYNLSGRLTNKSHLDLTSTVVLTTSSRAGVGRHSIVYTV